MNRVLVFVIASVISVCSFAAPSKTVKLKGKITHPLADSISVSYIKDWIDYSPKVFSAKVAPDGTFSLSFTIPEDLMPVDIQHGEQSTEILVEPGYDLILTVDAANFDSTLHYEGKGKELANFMARHVLEQGVMQSVFTQAQPFYTKEPGEFLQALDDLVQKQVDFLKAGNTGLPKSFESYWNNYYKYFAFYNMLNYPRFHEMAKLHSYNIGSIPAENYAVSDKVSKAFDDKLLSMPVYRMFSTSYYDAVGTRDGKSSKNTPEEQARQNMPMGTLEYYLANNYFHAIKYAGIDSSERSIAGFKKEFPNSRYLDLLETTLARKKSMSAGQPAVDLNLVTIEGKKMKLSDLKGKVVFLDFWASWCGPCIAEMPASKEVREHFTGKDVVFLYISIDDNEDKWKEAIEKHEIKGVHVRDGGGWAAPAAKKYSIQSIPAYFLVDRNGKYAMNLVPRPSDTEALIAAIEKLL